MYNDNDEPKTLYDEYREAHKTPTFTDVEDMRLKQQSDNVKSEGGEKYYPLDDTGNANRFIDRYGEEFRYNVNDKVWMIWNGVKWARDDTQQIRCYADKLIEYLRYKLRGMEKRDDNYMTEFYKNIKRLSNTNGKDAMLKEVVHLGKTAVKNCDFDNDKELLNCENGVVDLRTGKMKPHSKEMMMSKSTGLNIDMENEPTRWVQYLNEVFQGDQQLIEYVQCALGYSLTGYNIEQCMFQLVGVGSNGKSVFIEVIQNILGDYSVEVDKDTLLAKSYNTGGNASPDIAKIDGARLLTANEPNDGDRINETLIKCLVGGDKIIARKLYGNQFEFKPMCKLWISTNYKLTIRGRDDGIWRRQRIIPFNRKFEGSEVDKFLPEKLKKEYPQILGWCVKGAMKWFKGAEMKAPVIIQDAVKEYRSEMDVVSSFLRDNVNIVPNGREKAGDVYRAYAQWCRLGNEFQMSQSKFGKIMAEKYPKKMIAGYAYYVGMVLKSNDHAYIFTRENL